MSKTRWQTKAEKVNPLGERKIVVNSFIEEMLDSITGPGQIKLGNGYPWASAHRGID